MDRYLIIIFNKSLNIVAFGLKFALLFLMTLSILYIIYLMIHRFSEKKAIKSYKIWLNKLPQILKKNVSIQLKIKKSEVEGFITAITFLLSEEESFETKKQLKKLYINSNLMKSDKLTLTKPAKWWQVVRTIQKIGQLQLTELSEHIIPHIYSKNLEIKYIAIKVLAQMKSELFYDEIENLYKKSSRWTYLYITSVLNAHRVPFIHIVPLSQSKNRYVKKASAIMLGGCKEKEAIAILKDLAEDNIKDIRKEAVISLGEIGTMEALQILEKKIHDNNKKVKIEAIKAISKIDGHYIKKHIEELHPEADFDIKYQLDQELKDLLEKESDIIEKYDTLKKLKDNN